MCNGTRRVTMGAVGLVVGWIVVALVIYAIITNPTQAAGTTSNLASGLASVGQQIVTFAQSVAASATRGAPSDGSTNPPSGSTNPTSARGPSATCPEDTSVRPVTFPNGNLGIECVPS
jgi:hypothetical protein